MLALLASGCLTVAALGLGGPATASTGGGGYVALGDSYTAGPLIGLSFERNSVPIGCAQSHRSYPYLVAAALHPSSFTDVSCSGSTTEDFSSPQKVPGGVNAPEFDALRPDTALVTIGVGGNDVNLVGLAEGCINLLPVPLGPAPLGGSCAAEDTAGGKDVYGERIEAFAPKFAAMLQEVHRRSPHAEVYVVGYPDVLPQNTANCWPYAPLLSADADYVRDKVAQLNAVEASVAAKNDATFVDTWTSSIGHDACQPIGTAWVNGIVMLPLSAPLHPNKMGEANDAAQVLKAIRAAA